MNYARANLILEEISKEYPRGAGLVFLFMWDTIKDVFEAVSYTHLTLPTNREV